MEINMHNRRSTDQSYAALVLVVEEMKADQAEFRAELKKNSELTAKINTMTEEMVDLFAAAKGAFRVLGWFGTCVKWLGGIAGAGAALWALLSHSPIPPK